MKTKDEIEEKASEYVEDVKDRIDSYAYLDVQEAFKKGAEWMQEQANGDDTDDEKCHIQNVSISLRDFFAAEAMKAECISWNAEMSNEHRAKILEDMIERWGETTVYEAIALNSYEMADNMLKAKSRNEC